MDEKKVRARDCKGNELTVGDIVMCVDSGYMDLFGEEAKYKVLETKSCNIIKVRLLKFPQKILLCEADLFEKTHSIESSMREAFLKELANGRVDFRNYKFFGADLSGINFSGVNLEGADLSGVDFSYAHLDGVNFTNANLREASFEGSTLSDIVLKNADLTNANFKNTVLQYVEMDDAKIVDGDLRGAILEYTSLKRADFQNASLGYSILKGADFTEANLKGVNLYDATVIKAIFTNADSDENTKFLNMVCPKKGSFIGWKRCSDNKIVKLRITEDAKRSSATTKKCRCSRAEVLSIEELNGDKMPKGTVAESLYNRDFVYEVGKFVEEPDFCEDRWMECAKGIHFFMTREEAVSYMS